MAQFISETASYITGGIARKIESRGSSGDPWRSLCRSGKPPLQPLHQPVELRDVVAVEAWSRRAHGGAGDGTAAPTAP